MANRHLSRSVAMQILFEKDFNESFFSEEKTNKEKIGLLLKKDVEEFAPGLEDTKFVSKIIEGVLKNQKKLDSIIERAAPEWPLNQIAIVDRNILRIGLYELIFGDKKEVPPKVAINEAIELAKNFGGESSSKFINGVLGTVFRELGLEVEEKMPEENLAGAVVYKKEGKDIFFAFVHDVFGYWTLSKGHIEKNESAEDGAKREVKEEIGLDINIEKILGSNDYVASDPEKGKIKKIVTYFLASAKNKNIKLKKSGGLDDANWFKMEEINDLKMYEDIRKILAKAVEILIKHNV